MKINMLPKNPLFGPFEKLCQSLTIILAICYSFNNRLKSQNKQLVDNYAKNNINIDHLYSGVALPICDLTIILEKDYHPDYYIAGMHSVKGEEYINYTDTLLFKTNAWLIAQSYEVFETFLKDIMSNYLVESQDYVTKNEAKQFVRKCFRGKNNRELLKCMRNIAPLLNCFEKINSRGIDLKAWYEAVSKIRHAVTHTNSFILKKEIQGTFTTVSKYFSLSESNGGYLLTIKKHETTKAIECFGEYALLIYKCMSLSKNYKWENENTKST